MIIKHHTDKPPEALSQDAYDEFLLAVIYCATNNFAIHYAFHAGKTDSVENAVESFKANFDLAKVRFEKFLLQASTNQVDTSKSNLSPH